MDHTIDIAAANVVREDIAGANAVRTPAARAANAILEDLRRQLILLDANTKLSLVQREQVRHAIRGLRLAADRLEEALDSNRAVQALEALQLVEASAQSAAGIAAGIGQGRNP